MTFTLDAPSTEDLLAAVLSFTLDPLPAQEQRLGASTISWWETDPGVAYIHAQGGSPDDRAYGSTLVDLQLTAHGFRRAQFDTDDAHVAGFPPPPGTHACPGCQTPMLSNGWTGWTAVTPEGYQRAGWQCPSCGLDLHSIENRPMPLARTASWPDVMAKAMRLLQSGNVTLLRNGYVNVMGHVIGDHGEYDTEFSRDDPESRAITQWQCTCPWDQYAWQRTRKWKKFEGRYCSHVQALIWKSQQTPLDEQLTEEQANNLGTGQAIGDGMGGLPPEGAPTEGPGPDSHEFKLPRSFGPDGEIIQGDQPPLPNMPPEAIGGPPGPAQAPLAPPPGQGGPPQAEQPGGPTPPGILPPFPGAPPEEAPWAGPGTTPGGGVSPPGAYSVPGAKPPNLPNNPLQNPGTYSRTGAQFTAPEVVRLKKDMMGMASGPVPGQYGDGEYRDVPIGTPGEVLSQDQSTGWVEVIFALNDSGYHEPFHVTCFCEPGDIEATDQTNAFIRRQNSQ